MSGESSLISISTPLGDDVLIFRQAKVKEQLGQPFQIDVELISDDEDVALENILGKNVTIRMETSEDQPRFFNGIVTEFFQKDNKDKNAFYGAVIRPWFWLLTLSEHCRIFQEKSYPDIIKAVFSDLGFSDFEDQLTATYQAKDYVVQFNESDFNFVSRIMQQEGIFYYFKHINGKHSLVLTDDSSSLPDLGQVNFFELEENSKHHGVEGITSWHNHFKVRSGGVSLRSFDFELPTKNLDSVTADPKTASLSSLQRYSYPGKYAERGDGDQYTKLLMQKENAGFEQKSLSGNIRTLYAGAQFSLFDYTREDQNSSYLICGYQCHLRGDALRAEKGNEKLPMFEFNATAIPANIPFRPEQNATKPKMTGPQTATVVGKSGEEIWTDKYGRVKVLFHWDKEAQGDEKSSCWIRVSQSLAGKNWGSIYIPRVGQEVLVEFLNGDPDKPIIIGCVYNGSTMPPYPLPANATMSGIKSRTSKGGGGFNEIRMEDKKGEEQIFVHGKRNIDTRIGHNCFQTIGNDKHLVVKNDHFERIENNQNVEIEGDSVSKVGKDQHFSVIGKDAKSVDSELSLTVKGDVSETFDAGHSMVVKKDSYIKGANICIEAGTNLTLQVGKSFIAIESGGITISSPGKVTVESKAAIKVDASATVDISASGMATLKGSMVKVN
ncbi:type VI secretion system Vgr family protein [Agaribacter marinus]|uniref:Type VI secretion system secreted protein VgrG n=1 Tax=Agaribacter marinus TaxID=1431249 RepID=A0AA37T077_9ALTE|nr:type VI secretion system tip protein TssI/VgrG [Agaribacter marinus]GLR71894.1 hypothetical protein GCM10007852_28020 [Agaribacter marinus]